MVEKILASGPGWVQDVGSWETPKVLASPAPPADPHVCTQVKKKLSKVRLRRYIAKGLVRSLTRFFPVKKGDDDIRVVYDGTASGLNDALWAPSFSL